MFSMRKRSIFIVLTILVVLVFLMLGANSEVYDAGDTTTFKAYEDSLSDPIPPDNTLPPDGQTEHTGTEYSNIEFSDDNSDSTSVGDDFEGYLFLNATVSNFASISSLNWTWEGAWEESSSGEADKENLSFYMWNNSGSSWFECANPIPDSGGVGDEDIVNCYQDSNIDDFFDASGNTYFLVYGTDSDDGSDSLSNTIKTDYVGLEAVEFIVTLESPTNNTFVNNNAQTFDCSINGSNLKNSSLQIWNSTRDLIHTNSTDISGTTNTTSNIFTFGSDGEYHWNCHAWTNGDSSKVADSNRTITIDTTLPIINYDSGTPNDFTNSTDTSLLVNVSVTESNKDSITFDLYNSTGVFNSTSLPLETLCYQEQADETTACGGLDTGSYAFTNNFIFINYTKPSNANNKSVWTVKHGSFSAYNVSIPNTCFTKSSDTLSLRFYSEDSFSHASYGQCYNGTWVNITNKGSGSTGGCFITSGNFSSKFYDSSFSTSTKWDGTSWKDCDTSSGLGGQLNEEAMNWELDTETYINFTPLSDGLYQYNVSVNDSANNLNTSETRNFRVDTTAPNTTIEKPTNNEEFSTNTSLELNHSGVDIGVGTIDSCWWSIDDVANISLPSCNNILFNTSDGTHNVKVYRNDSLGNEGYSEVNFTISLNAPAITLISPTDKQFLNYNSSVNLTYQATDSNGIAYCDLYHNVSGAFGFVERNDGVTSGQSNFTEINNLDDGQYKWNEFCEDGVGSSRFSATNFTFTIDTTDPVLVSPSISTTEGSQTVSFNASGFTEINCNVAKYSVFASGGAVENGLENITSSCSDFAETFVVSDFAEYTLRIMMVDKAGNEDLFNKNFTTTQLQVPSGQDGSSSSSSDDSTRIQAVNFSIENLGGGKLLDFVLAKDSVKSREKFFVLINRDIEEVTVNIECDSSSINSSLQTPENEEIDICDYVELENTTLTLTPNEVENTLSSLSVRTPENASFDDKYTFELVVTSDSESGDVYFDKLSVSVRVPLWGVILKWSPIPFQNPDLSEIEKSSYPVLAVSIFISFAIFALTLLLLVKRLQALSVVLGGVFLFTSLFALTYLL